MRWKQFASIGGDEALAELQSRSEGLSLKEATRREQELGQYRMPESSLSIWRIFRRQIHSSFLILLLVAAALSFFLGDVLEGTLIIVFIVINISLGCAQEYHSEKSLRLLKRYLVTHSKVLRDEKEMVIESEKVVLGDVVVLEAGDRLPADVRFLVASGLQLDESVLTGESVAVEKKAAMLSVPAVEVYEAANIGFAGTVVTAGSGRGVVFALGKDTAVGDIAQLSEETEKETVFEKGIRQFSQFILRLVLSTLLVIFLANVFIRGGEADAIELLIFSLALAVSVVPEALPVILTVALSRGSLRLAQKKVVVKRLSAIEDLGSIEILCTDKTGTLTENVLSVSHIKAAHEEECLRDAFLSTVGEPLHRGKLHDAFDLALWQALPEAKRSELAQWKRVANIPFDPERRRNSVLLERGGERMVVVRGAPEEVLHLSENVDSYTRKHLLEWVSEVGRSGERVLAVAKRGFPAGRTYSVLDEQQLQFVGMISFADTLKKSALQTIEKAKHLNVAVKILTGDHAEVAGAVGYAVGLIAHPDDVITGKQLDSFSEAERHRAIFQHAVFARISPRQKFEIIKVLQEKYEVGFLGEGINDAPALKIANVAIVVQGASDVARESADIVLLQKSLGVIVDGIGEGRTIFANILKYLKVTLTSNFGNFYSVALSSLFLPFVPLLPIQILLLNLLSDFPMIAIATDSVDAPELEKPKNYHVHSIVLIATFLGIVSSIFDFILFGTLSRFSPEVLRTAWFLLSVVTEVILIFSLRTRLPFFRAKRSSLTLFLLSVFVVTFSFSLPFLPWLAEPLGFIRPTLPLLLFVGLLAVAYFVATEAVKHFYYKHFSDAKRV